ncbi:MAG: LysM peptidoglycan-binding domain-containing protein [Actinomycetota bacterium]|nr:LysM peptidoglycan-binding domain-containing protein [Actinomycetota bacterium]MDQ3640087.1 LysM peptidoglycan-binding domain-containing protein [Actinomycetota bacterium]
MRIRQITSLAAVVAAESAALLVLHRLESSGAIDWGNLGRWLADTPPEDALVEVVRLAGLVVAWWLAATTVLYVLARLTRVPTLVQSVEWATLAPVRRVVDGILATSIFAGSTFGATTIASAEPRAPSPVVIQLDRQTNLGEPASNPAYRPRPAGDGGVRGPANESKAATTTTARAADHVPPQPTPTSVPPRTEPVSQTSETLMTYMVQPGDNLWRVAERQLAKATGRSAGEIEVPEIRAYWTSLVETNRDLLRSGNPDVIYPGEKLRLPVQR